MSEISTGIKKDREPTVSSSTEGLASQAAREIGVEFARLYREAQPGMSAERPHNAILASADEIISRCALQERRPTEAPVPTPDELRILAVATGYTRALKEVLTIRGELTPVTNAGQQLVDSLKEVSQLGPYRETIDFLRQADCSLAMVLRTTTSGKDDVGFIVVKDDPSSITDVDEWHAGIDRVLDTFNARVYYLREGESRIVDRTVEKLRLFHSALAGMEKAVLRHFKSDQLEATEASDLTAGLASLAKPELDVLIPSILKDRQGKVTHTTALFLAFQEEGLRTILADMRDTAIPAFMETMSARAMTPEHPHVVRELTRLDDMVRLRVSNTERAPLHETIAATTEIALRTNLVAKLGFLLEGRGERFDATLDEISRKVGPKVALDRFNQLTRACRGHVDEELAPALLKLEHRILTLGSREFPQYLEQLRSAIKLSNIEPPAKLLPDILAERNEKTNGAPAPQQSATVDQREVQIIGDLEKTGLDGALALAVLKHGFHHHGSLFAGNHTINRQRVLNFVEPKVEAQRGVIADCLAELIRRGAVLNDSGMRGLSLNRINDISEPALKAAVSYVEGYWREHRGR